MPGLEPGGYLQWDERDMHLKVAGELSEKTRAMEKLVMEVSETGKMWGSDFKYLARPFSLPFSSLALLTYSGLDGSTR
jgi:hypothetical protein